jgi:4-hydroxy-tetrahydrodipicolinate synthase
LIGLLRRFRTGNRSSARELFTRFLPLLVFEQQPGVAIRKEILYRWGLLSSNRVRAPGATIDAATTQQLDVLLTETFLGQDIRTDLRKVL